MRVPWYLKRAGLSFVDAVSALRGELSRAEVSSKSEGEPRLRDVTRPLVEALSLSR